MRFIPRFRKKKPSVDAAQQAKQAPSSESDQGPGSNDSGTQAPASGSGVVVREDYFTFRQPSNESLTDIDIRRSSSLSGLAVSMHERSRQSSFSFPDMRSFTDEYIQRKYVLREAGCSGLAAWPIYPAYPPFAAEISQDGPSTSGGSTGSSPLDPSANPPMSTAADAYRLPLRGDPNIVGVGKPLDRALRAAFSISPSASRALTATRSEQEREQNLVRALVRYSQACISALSSVSEGTGQAVPRRRNRANAPSLFRRSVSSLTRQYMTFFKLNSRSSSRESGTSTAVSVTTPTDDVNFGVPAADPPKYVCYPQIKEAEELLERGQVPVGYLDYSPIPGSCILAFPCPKTVRERVRKNRSSRITRYLTLLTIIAFEFLSLYRILDNFQFVRGTFGIFYVVCASLALLFATCCALLMLLSYWTQIEWAHGNRSSALLFPKNQIMV